MSNSGRLAKENGGDLASAKESPITKETPNIVIKVSQGLLGD